MTFQKGHKKWRKKSAVNNQTDLTLSNLCKKCFKCIWIIVIFGHLLALSLTCMHYLPLAVQGHPIQMCVPMMGRAFHGRGDYYGTTPAVSSYFPLFLSVTFCPFSFLDQGKPKCFHTLKILKLEFYKHKLDPYKWAEAQMMMGVHGPMVTVTTSLFCGWKNLFLVRAVIWDWHLLTMTSWHCNTTAIHQ